MKKIINNQKGFTVIVLLVAVVIVLLLSLFAMKRTMNRVNTSLEENNMNGKAVPEPTIQNYQQTLDNVRENVNQSVQKEQQKIDDAQKEMAK